MTTVSDSEKLCLLTAAARATRIGGESGARAGLSRLVAAEGLVLNRVALLIAVALFGFGSSVAFSRLSGRSAFAAMGFALVAVACLALVVFLVFTILASQFV